MLTVLVVLCSGAAALLFETLFFRVAALALGVTQWAAAAVLAGFMLGLGGGALWVLARDHRITRPGRTFLWVEAIAAGSACLLVWLLPQWSALLATLLGTVRDEPVLLHSLRMLLAILLFALPAGAMGATLPLWLRAVAGFSGRGYGVRLGVLYGANVAGAVAGALACEFLLIPAHGIPGAALAGLLVSGVAILAAWTCLRAAGPGGRAATAPAVGLQPPAALLAVSFLCGVALLGLEISWFRFLHLYVINSAGTFAVMLACLLGAGALGSLLAAVLLAFRPARDAEFAVLFALLAGGAVVAAYAWFDPAAAGADRYWHVDLRDTALLTARLVCLPALFSGALFTVVGSLLRAGSGSDSATAGAWLASNTVGAVLGSLLAAFVLVPWLGLQRSLQVLAACYLVAAVLLLPQVAGRWWRWGAMAALLLALVPVVQIPVGLEAMHLARATEKFRARDGSDPVLVRHTASETLQYLQRNFLGAPWYHRQVTDGFSMSSTAPDSRRYMELYAWWPAAAHPQLQSALLVSYGLGTTASALLDVPGLQSLDVVDISPEILETSSIAHEPGHNPLHDPRVQVFIEDGRFYLNAPRQQYDLVTGEPPPPRARGVVNLYTREYFALVRGALRPGGLFTYWLPVDQMNVPTTRAIIRAFCDVFPDCGLWAGANYNWMLTGSRSGGAPLRFSAAPWQDDTAAARLDAVGLEAPGALAATFIADASTLRQWSAGAAPLVDAHPGRLRPDFATEADLSTYFRWMDDVEAERRFRTSAAMRSAWPPELQEQAARFFPFQGVLNYQVRPGSPGALVALDAVLRHSRMHAPVLWLLDSDARRQRIAGAQTELSGEVRWHRAARALAGREYHRALDWLRGQPLPDDAFRAHVRHYLFCVTGRTEEGRAFARRLAETRPWQPRFRCEEGGQAF